MTELELHRQVEAALKAGDPVAALRLQERVMRELIAQLDAQAIELTEMRTLCAALDQQTKELIAQTVIKAVMLLSEQQTVGD